MWAQGVWVRTQTGEVCVWRKSLRTCHQPTKSYSVSWTYWCGHCHHKRADLDTRLIITFVLSCIFVFVGVGGSSSCEWPWPFSSYNWLPGCQNVWNDFVTWTVPVCVSSALGERHDTTHVHRRNTAWAVSVCGGGGGSVCVFYFGWRELQNRCHKMLGLALFLGGVLNNLSSFPTCNECCIFSCAAVYFCLPVIEIKDFFFFLNCKF